MRLQATDFRWAPHEEGREYKCVAWLTDGGSASYIGDMPVAGVQTDDGLWRIRATSTPRLVLYPHGPFSTREACLATLRLLT